MNILLYRYNSICEDAVIRGLRELGHNVAEVTLEMENKSPSGNEILSEVREAVEKNNTDIIFSINYYPVLSEICRVFKILYFSWIVDAPVLELYSETIKNRCNRVFIFDSELYKEIAPYNPYNIFYLPLAADCEFYQNAIQNASNSDIEKFIDDLFKEDGFIFNKPLIIKTKDKNVHMIKWKIYLKIQRGILLVL